MKMKTNNQTDKENTKNMYNNVLNNSRKTANHQNIFKQANQFIMPQTSLFDFFDYLAGEKLEIPNVKPVVQDLKITFKHIDLIPQKMLCQKSKLKNKISKQVQNDGYRPIFLKEISQQQNKQANIDTFSKDLILSKRKKTNQTNGIRFDI